MDIRILHIDDESDVLDKAHQIINELEMAGHKLLIADSCGFEEGMVKLQQVEYDLVILDLCTGSASYASDKVGQEVFGLIKSFAFIPVIFFTGLPDYVKDLKSDIVRVAGKADGYDALFAEIDALITSGLLVLKSEVNSIVKEGLRTYFWKFIHPNAELISALKVDDVSLKYLLLRRLGKTLAGEITRTAAENPGFNKANSHPMEFYIYPPIEGEFETGDLITSKDGNSFFIVLTPSCDLVVRSSGKRSAERILIVHTIDFRTIPEFAKLQELRTKEKELAEKKQTLSKDESAQLKNLPAKIKEWMKPKKNERFFFLPQTPFCPPLLIDFEHKTSLTYEELDNSFNVVATLDDPISLAVLAGYSRYYSRVGYQDLDTDYAFDQICSGL